jgi:hypothetical protein
MFYIFADERYQDQSDRDGTQRFVIGLVALPQHQWSGLDAGYNPPSRINVLKRMLEDARGVGVIVYADIDPDLVRPGIRDATAEITDMARRDTAWSVCLAQGIAATIALLYRRGVRDTTVDVYHDTRDIKPEHRGELGKVVTYILPKIVQYAVRREGAPSNYKPRFRRFEDVPNQGNSEQRTKFQEGVLIADRLCRLAPKLIDQPPGAPICIRNIRDRVVNTLSKFESLRRAP